MHSGLRSFFLLSSVFSVFSVSLWFNLYAALTPTARRSTSARSVRSQAGSFAAMAERQLCSSNSKPKAVWFFSKADRITGVWVEIL